MRIIMKKRKIIVISVVIVILVLGALALKFYQNTYSSINLWNINLDDYSCKIPDEYSSFYDLDTYLIPGIQDENGEEYWRLSSVMFVNLGLVSNEYGDFVIGGVLDKDDICQKIIIRLSSNIEEETNGVLAYEGFSSVWFVDEYVDANKFQTKSKKGDYLIGFYLTKNRFDDAGPQCDDYSGYERWYCEIESFQSFNRSEEVITLDGNYKLPTSFYVPIFNKLESEINN